ncbi:MAG: hypothetical protein GY788_15305 [bacterium]|nr:hypothetical protein [bacterium]
MLPATLSSPTGAGSGRGVGQRHPAPDGDVISVSVFDDTSVYGAAVSVDSDGSYSFDPTGLATIQALDTGESHVDSFTYTIDDGNGGTDSSPDSVASFVEDAGPLLLLAAMLVLPTPTTRIWHRDR